MKQSKESLITRKKFDVVNIGYTKHIVLCATHKSTFSEFTLKRLSKYKLIRFFQIKVARLFS